MATKPYTPYSVEEQQLARRRSMAESLMQQMGSYQAPPSKGPISPKASPLNALVRGLGLYMTSKQLKGLDQEDSALGARKAEAASAAEAAAKRTALVKLVAEQTGKRAKPESLRDGLMNEDPSMFQYHEQSLVPKMLGDKQYLEGLDEEGNPKPYFAPQPGSQVNVNTAEKLGAAVNNQGGQYFMYGGKGREKFDTLMTRLNVNQSLLQTLAQNPSMGAGAEAFQLARKWAETLGAPVSETTTPTEMAKMQLGQMTLERLGGLGAQVSDADRKFMLETQGTLTSDPEALRRMMLIEAKYTMQALSGLRQGRTQMQERLGESATLPEYTFSAKFPERDANDIENLFMNRPFTVPGQPAPAAARPPAGGMPSRFKPVRP